MNELRRKIDTTFDERIIIIDALYIKQFELEKENKIEKVDEIKLLIRKNYDI